jgi:hypothetical protein
MDYVDLAENAAFIIRIALSDATREKDHEDCIENSDWIQLLIMKISIM